MTISMPRQSIRRFLRWSRFTMFSAAAGLLGYCAFVVADACMFQWQAAQELAVLRLRPGSPAGPGSGDTSGLLGRMEIPRLGISVIVAEGTGGRTLRRAAGHISGTAQPGQTGNVGIAGHRDTLFRPLRDIRLNDVITLTTLQAEFRYRVVSTQIVSPADVAVLDSGEQEILTLVTCYPFYFAGPAPDRFIVRAERVANRT